MPRMGQPENAERSSAASIYPSVVVKDTSIVILSLITSASMPSLPAIPVLPASTTEIDFLCDAVVSITVLFTFLQNLS